MIATCQPARVWESTGSLAACKVRLSVNENLVWRERVGHLLRRLATTIDGRRSLALKIQSRPALCDQQINDAIAVAIDVLHDGLLSETRMEALEEVFRDQKRHYFVAEQNKTKPSVWTGPDRRRHRRASSGPPVAPRPPLD